VQLLAAYTNPESECTASQTDGQTDGQQAAVNSRSYCVAVRSAKTISAVHYVHGHRTPDIGHGKLVEN